MKSTYNRSCANYKSRKRRHVPSDSTIPHSYKALYFIFILFGIVLFSGLGSAVECDANMNNSQGYGFNSCTVSNSLNLNGSYNININFTVFTINSDNIKLNCNNSIFYGNTSDNSASGRHGISSTNKFNITIENCNFKFLDRAFFFRNSSNIFILNSSANNTRVGLMPDNLAENVSILNSSFRNVMFGNHLNNATNILINNNVYENITLRLVDSDSGYFAKNITFSNNIASNGDSKIITGGNDNNWTDWYIFNNTLQNTTTFISNPIGLNNFYIYNNYLFNSTDDFWISIKNGSNGHIFNNIIDIADSGIIIQGNSYNISIFNNNISNSWTNHDAYDAGILIATNSRNSSSKINNLRVYNNILTNYGCVGILIRDLQNSTIENNIFTQESNFLINRSFRCSNEPFMGIFIHQLYKGFIPALTQSTDNYDVASLHQSDNLIIRNNTFNNIQVPLRIQGIYNNITYDINNYWFKQFNLPFYSDFDKFFISNNFTNLTGIDPIGQFTSILKQGINNNFSLNYSISQYYEYYKNINSFSLQLNLYNKTNSLISFSNGSVACSNINSCDGNINITLTPNNHSYVLDNFNLTEGVSRLNSPLWFAQTSLNEIHIASNLTDSITATVIVTPRSEWGTNFQSVNRVTYTPNGGSSTVYDGQDARNFLSVLTSTGQELLLNPSQSSNELIIETACSSFTLTGFRIIMIFASLMLILVIGNLIYNRGLDGFNINEIFLLAVVIIVCVILWQVSGQNLGAACPVN